MVYFRGYKATGVCIQKPIAIYFMRKSFFFLLTILPFFLISCFGEFFNDLNKMGNPEWNPSLGVPVASGSFSLAEYLDVVADSITISEQSDGVVVLSYSGPPVSSPFAEEMIAVPDQQFRAAIGLTNTEIGGLPVNLTLTKQANYSFTVDTQEADLLDSMVLKSGVLDMSITGTFPASGSVQLVFNPITLNGNTFAPSFSWTYDPANPQQNISSSVDLAGANIDFTNGGSTTNNFNFDLVLTINYEGQPISSGDSLIVNLQMSNPRFGKVFGKFAQRNFNTEPDTVFFSLLDSIMADTFYLANPQINLAFSNSFGLPVSASLAGITAVNTQGQTMPLSGTIINNPVTVNYPDINQVGQAVNTTISINKDNSNIDQLIAFLPVELRYQFTGNVLSADPQTEQFVLDTSQVTGNYEIVLPLSGRVMNFSSTQEFDFDGSTLEPLNETTLIVHATNGLPLTVSNELVFLDVAGQPLDTLFSGQSLLESGALDENGFVVSPTESTVEVTLTAAQTERLQAAKKLVLLSTLNTGIDGSRVVNIRMDDRVQVSVFLQTKINL